MKNRKKEILLLLILFLIIFAIRIPYISNPVAENGDAWRQADTESIARNFVQHKFNIFYPQFNYEGPLPNYIQLEFQITTFLIGILYKLFGYKIYLARLVPIGFFMISAYFLYKLTKEIYSRRLGWIATFIYSILPINIFFSRAIMPESAGLAFFMGGYYYFYKWYKHDRNNDLFISAILTALAISQKTPLIFMGLAMILLSIDKYGLSFIKRIELWLFGILALVPPLAYIIWSGSISELKFVQGIGAKHILPNFATSFLTGEAMEFYKMALPRSFTGIILILSLIGLFTLTKKKDRPILYLAGAMILEVLLIVSVIKFRYYLVFITPIIAILAGKILDLLLETNKIGIILVVLALTYTGYSSYNRVIDDFVVHETVVDFAKTIDENLEPGQVVVTGYFDPARISMSNRQGFRANIKYYPQIPQDPPGEVNYFIENGAEYFMVYKGYIYDDSDGQYLNYLEENFESKTIKEDYKLYKLSN